MAQSMTASEKRGLEKVIRERFKALRRGVDAKQYSIKAQFLAEIEKDEKAKREEFMDRVADLRERAEALAAESRKLRDDAIKAGFKFRDHRSYSSEKNQDPITFSVYDEVVSINAEKMADAKTKEIVRTVNQKLHTAAIDIMETRLLEDLWIDDLESDKAREFLKKIPTLSDLVKDIAHKDPLALEA